MLKDKEHFFGIILYVYYICRAAGTCTHSCHQRDINPKSPVTLILVQVVHILNS